MTRLSTSTLSSIASEVSIPEYDRGAVVPGILHIGVGHFHRAHQAMFLERLHRAGLGREWGVFGVSMRPDAPVASFAEQDHLYTLTEKHPDGRKVTSVIGAIVGFASATDGSTEVLDRLAAPSTRIVTLTITEGGYCVDPATGAFDGARSTAVSHDLADPGAAQSWLGLLLAGFARRAATEAGPITVLSCDNIQDNGRATATAVRSFAAQVAPELLGWIDANVTFPSSMVDRVVPGTSDADRRFLGDAYDLDDAWAVTSEPFAQWTIEDHFANGRPAFEEVGVDVVPDVAPYERMKLRLANGIHQGLCFFGRLLDHEYVHDAIADPDIRALLLRYIDEEAVPSLDAIPGVDFGAWGREVLVRFGNPQLRDPIERISAETSDRIPTFLLPVVVDRIRAGGSVTVSAAIVASWARYATGVDEHGDPIRVVDPRAAEIQAAAAADALRAGAFLDLDVFAGIRDSDAFAVAYREARRALDESGARATLRSLAAAPAKTGVS
ncbi:mannitol dehydrogenase family protein [Herbiconiux sp. UC225_62]|uniref:mannitol dehydrogenase family protein n=1 Tax=Herbiconiux sp. UC225_62 TaxID=3350168 RepID=UPI0036D226F8